MRIITARAEYDGVVHRIYEFLAAVGIGIAGGIVVMCTVVNHAAILGQRQRLAAADRNRPLRNGT